MQFLKASDFFKGSYASRVVPGVPGSQDWVPLFYHAMNKGNIS